MGTLDKLAGVGSTATPGTTPAKSSRPSTDALPTFAAALAHAAGHGVSPLRPASVLPAAAPAPATTPTGHKVKEHSLNQRALALWSKRQELISANIANADTPNYKAVDIDVPEALRLGYTPETVPILYRSPSQSSLDGNSVEMDAEMAKFVENTIRLQFSIDRVSGHYKMMSELFKNLTP